MSWDVLFQDFPKGINSVNEIKEDFKPNCLCTREYYEKMVMDIFPDIDKNNDPSWMILERDGFSIEFNAGSDDPMESLMLHVRGNDNALKVIKDIVDYSGWKALDTSLGDFIDFGKNPDEGFSQWRDYRNKVEIYVKNEERKKNKKWYEFWK